jgi:hypothetical protein
MKKKKFGRFYDSGGRNCDVDVTKCSLADPSLHVGIPQNAVIFIVVTCCRLFAIHTALPMLFVSAKRVECLKVK